MIIQLLNNHALIGALVAWAIAQIIKVPLDYRETHKGHWSLLLQPGGMPSSHSALVEGTESCAPKDPVATTTTGRATSKIPAACAGRTPPPWGPRVARPAKKRW